jgi:hypothetical protein
MKTRSITLFLTWGLLGLALALLLHSSRYWSSPISTSAKEEKMNRQTQSMILATMLSLALLLSPIPSIARASQYVKVDVPFGRPVPAVGLPESLEGISDVSTDWWAAVQEDIRQSEYHVTWQEHTYLANVDAAYQAPNRAHNLRTYFTPEGLRVIPRVFEGEIPPWEWGLTLAGYGYAVDPSADSGQTLQPVAEATLTTNGNRIEYQRELLAEWYVNDERDLEQGFTLHAPPHRESQGHTIALDLALGGDLIPHLAADGSTVEFTTPPSTSSGHSSGVVVLHYGGLVVTDATSRQLPARLSLEGEGRVRIAFDATSALYPITVDPTISGLAPDPAWTAESDQASAYFGTSVGTAGDVNGDGYSDVIVGAYLYDNGQTGEGRAYVYHGSAMGLSPSPAWTAESDQAGAYFGISVGTAGDVNGDGYSDVIVGASEYNNGQTQEGQAFVYHGAATGLSPSPAWTADSDQIGSDFGFSVGTAGDVNGDGYSDVIVGAPYYDNDQWDEGRAYVYHGAATGLGASPAWTAESDQVQAHFGRSVGTAGDVNGDGYSDVIVGALDYDNGLWGEGRAYVYHGAATGLGTEPAWTAEGDQDGARFGISVGMAGDVNGDGYSDVIVGADSYGGWSEGRAYVYHGAATGLDTEPAWTADGDQANGRYSSSLGTAGDVNGDGYSDVIVGAYRYNNGQVNEGQVFVYHGAATGLGASPAWTAEGDQDSAYFGFSVGTAGDVNGDGYSDVIVGADGYDNGQTDEGRAYVYHGAATGIDSSPAWTAESDQAEAHFGYSVGTAGDVNGDGYSDVIVGAPLYDNGQTDEGRAYVYHGVAGGLNPSPAWTAEGDQVDAWFGLSVGTAGDVNGDGYSDIIVGAPGYDNGQADEGQAYVYHGAAAGLNPGPAWTAESDQAGAYFGASVGTAGDVNGDGYSDVIVGAYYYDNGQTDEGRAYVYHGATMGLGADPAWTAESDHVGAWFGASVGTAGDVNGDGYSDVIVGAPYYSNGQTDEGRAHVYHGTAAGLKTSPAWTAESDQAHAVFGYSVGTAGDVNGDGYSDIIVGAWGYDDGQSDEGGAFVYHGAAAGLGADSAWTVESDLAEAAFGFSVGTAGDVNGDGYSDVIIGAPFYDSGQTDEGRAYVYHGALTGLGASPAWTAEGDQTNAVFGTSVGTAGDVNGDGYSDVIVGAPYYNNGQSEEGWAFVYYGNGGDGLHLLPRQARSDGSAPVAHLGASDSRAFQLGLIGRMPLGREEVRLQWQVALLGTPLTATNVLSGTSGWTDVLTTGVEISQTVSGLAPDAPYHWRVRLLYRPGNALGQPAGRWVHIPWAGWNETDLRTVPNQPPVADAGDDQAVNTNATVTLDGSGSDDPDGDLPLIYLWAQIGGPVVTLSDLDVVSPTFTAPSDPAVLTFTLTITDRWGMPALAPDVVVITVQAYHVYLPLIVR